MFLIFCRIMQKQMSKSGFLSRGLCMCFVFCLRILGLLNILRVFRSETRLTVYRALDIQKRLGHPRNRVGQHPSVN